MLDRIKYLLGNPEETKKLGTIGKELVIREYNWRTEGKKLTYLIQRYCTKNSQPALENAAIVLNIEMLCAE